MINHRTVRIVAIAVAVGVGGCAKKPQSAAVQREYMMSRLVAGGGNGGSVFAATLEHFIAETHKLDLVIPEQKLQKNWESAVAFCATIQCEVLSSSVTAGATDITPSASLSLRVAPQDFPKVLAEAQKWGNIAQHTTQREDKTAQVVDTEARLKNLTSFRDNLRAMLAKPSATVKDLIEIQQQLTETQSQLDSQAAQRKILANETEKIAVDFAFRVNRSNTASSWKAVGNAFRESGAVLAESTANVITTIVFLIPWLILIVPAIWFIRKAWRRRRQRKAAALSSKPAPVS